MSMLILKDVRCFRGEHEAPLAPITILVGENSAGKSTLLALARVAWDIAFGTVAVNFNEDPFQLGAYDELAHYHGGRGKRATNFSVGISDRLLPSPRAARASGTDQDTPVIASIVGTFTAAAGQPTLSGVNVESGPWRLDVRPEDDHLKVHISTPSGEFELSAGSEYYPYPQLSGRHLAMFLEYEVFRGHGRRGGAEGSLPSENERTVLLNMLSGLRQHPGAARGRYFSRRPLAIAPIRSRPKRTYDPLSEIRSPEGEHVPMLLARLNTADLARWERLAEGLSVYGKSSGLFDQVVVRRFAGSESAPFQLRVKLAGQKKEVNLVDVGYGISQVLPILVDALMEPNGGLFLMQQPEVHLHPRAQAELGTFIVNIARQRGSRFLVETHSDYLVDRIRLEVKNKVIKPDAVSILFFERCGSQAKIHRIGLDAAGNIIGQPDTYRQFFLDEELRIIS